MDKPDTKQFPFSMIYDFFGVDAMTANPMERLIVRQANKSLVKVMTANPKLIDRIIMIGEVGDVPDKSFGIGLPNRREFLSAHGDFVGYVIRFDPKDYADKQKVRKKLGYGNEPLILCTKGGTACGRPLLDLCAHSFPLIRQKLPDAKMVIVAGPMVDTKSVPALPGIEVLGFVPNLYEYIAACDYCITQAGQTTTIEIMALRKPFAYFPLEQQFDQNITTGGRLRRLGAGTEMRYYRTTPQMLADTVLKDIGKPVTYESEEFNGADRAAEVLNGMLRE
jgi:predicted glycosyltransferase